jgi:glycosyltransferase involved in cell wall biosynthesis
MDDPDDLPARLIELLSDRDKCRRMGEAGFRRWRENFRYSAFKQRLLAHLDEFEQER